MFLSMIMEWFEKLLYYYGNIKKRRRQHNHNDLISLLNRIHSILNFVIRRSRVILYTKDRKGIGGGPYPSTGTSI